jgi:hypothetical protein
MARGVFWLTLTLWAALYAASFAVFWFVEPTGDSFTRGLNRIGWFLLLQMIAAGCAAILWVLTRRFPRGPGLRWLGRAPVFLALLLLALVLALYIYGNFVRSVVLPASPQPDRPVTAPAEPVAPLP